jgi:hypothetical protein
MLLTLFILLSVTVLKFHEGGWITILLTGSLVCVALLTRRHYRNTLKLLRRLDELVAGAEASCPAFPGRQETDKEQTVKYDPRDKTAILLVNGFNGLGLHTLFGIIHCSAGPSGTSCSSGGRRGRRELQGRRGGGPYEGRGE